MLLWSGHATGASGDYERAAELLASGDATAAARAFEAAAKRTDRPEMQADALFSAALLYEERLAKPDRAADLYQKIARDYPESRVALAASRRLRELSALLGDADATRALGAWKQLLHEYADLGPEAAVAQANKLLREHPEWVGRPMVFRWLGDQGRQRGDLRAAAQDYERALHATRSKSDQFQAVMLLAEVSLLSGDLDKARELVGRVADDVDPGRRRVLVDMRARLDSSWRRQQLSKWSYLVAAVCLLTLLASLRMAAGSTARTLSSLKRAPSEVLFVLPVVAILIVMSLASHEDIGPAVMTIGIGGIVFAWISGSALDAGQRSIARILIHIAIASLGIAALIFIAVEREQLIDQIAETVRFGPDG